MKAMTDRPILTIAISSYNRAAKLDSQIRWAAESIAGRWDQCQLLIADGASTDETPAVCEKWKASLGEKITCLRLPVNRGIVPGICFSIEESAGEYVWTVSDDSSQCFTAEPKSWAFAPESQDSRRDKRRVNGG